MPRPPHDKSPLLVLLLALTLSVAACADEETPPPPAPQVGSAPAGPPPSGLPEEEPRFGLPTPRGHGESPAPAEPSPPALVEAERLRARGEWRRAEECAREALAEGAAPERAWRILGLAAHARGAFAEAAEAFDLCLASRPDDGEVLFLSALAWLGLHERDEAITRLCAALQQEPPPPGARETARALLQQVEAPTLRAHLRACEARD